MPWSRLLPLIEPHYHPKAGPKGGRTPVPLGMMLRVYFLQQWYALSDPMAEETLYDSDAMRHFAGIELADGRISDEATILNFRHLLEKHELTEKLFAKVNSHLADQIIAMVRARVEHPLRVIKRQFGYLKTRYRGLAKNRAQLFTLFAFGNLFLVRRRLLA